MMKRKKIVIAVGVVVVIAGGMMIYRVVQANRDEAAFQEQLRLARVEGLPTNAAEVAATIQPASASENAAPYYRNFRPLMKSVGDPMQADRALLHEPSPKNLAAAREFTVKAKAALACLDQANALQRCWFDRDWSEGLAVLFREYGDMKTAAFLLALRGSVAAAEGNQSAAIANADEVFVLSKHAGEEGFEISAMVAQAIYSIGLHDLATWCFLHPDNAAYRNALDKAVKAEPRPNLRAEDRMQLWDVLSIIELCSTKEGRRKLGLDEDDLPATSNIFSFLQSQPKTKVAIVKAERDRWAALSLPEDKVSEAVDRADMRISLSLFAFPLAGKMFRELEGVGMEDPGDRLGGWQAQHLAYTAVLRAFVKGGVARTIQTSDLKSPFDNTPLTYSFNGKLMEIVVNRSTEMGPLRVKIPPDKVR